MSKVTRSQAQPLTVIFNFLRQKARIQVWLYEKVNMRIEGKLVGFDEFMNVVLDEAEEIDTKTKVRKSLGMILLKGDNITLIRAAPAPQAEAAGGATAAAGGAAAAAGGAAEGIAVEEA